MRRGSRLRSPTGRVEAGETDQQALKRGLLHRLGVEIDVGKLISFVSHPYEHYVVDLFLYECTLVTDAPLEPRAEIPTRADISSIAYRRWLKEKGVTFGTAEGADVRLKDVALQPGCSGAVVDVLGTPVTTKIAMPGRHIVQNMLAVLAVAKILGADLALASLALANLKPPPGRGVPIQLAVKGGIATVIDESYNANPASMRAALDVLSRTPVGPRGRRIAVLGDMLELGAHSEKLHAALAPLVTDAGARPVLLAGPHMASLAKALPAEAEVTVRATAQELKPVLLQALGGGDVVMVKSSKGIGFSKLVEALLGQFPAETEKTGQT